MPTRPGLSTDTGLSAAGTTQVHPQRQDPKGKGLRTAREALSMAFSSLCLSFFLWVHIS